MPFSRSWARFLALLLTGFILVPYLVAEDPKPAIRNVPLKGHSELVYGIALTPEGRMVVTGSFDRTIKVWDTITGKVVKTFGGGTTGHQNQVLAVDINSSGTFLASASADNTARIWDFPGTQPSRVVPFEDAVTSVKLSTDGTRAVAGLRDGNIRVWNPVDGKEVYRIPNAHKGGVTQVAFAASGQVIASTGADRRVRFWNATNGMPAGELGAHPEMPLGVVMNASGNQAVTIGSDGLKIWTLPIPASRKLGSPQGDIPTSMNLTADGSGIITGSADKQVRLFNFSSGQLTRAFAGPTTPVTTVASGNTWLAAGSQDSRLWLWNVGDGKLVGQLNAASGAVTGLAISPSNNQLASSGMDGSLKFWSLPLIPGRILPTPAPVLAQAATADGKKLYTAGEDGQILAWNTASWQQPERKFTGHTGAVHAVAVNPNGSLLVSGGKDELIRFWNPTNSQLIETYGGHVGPVKNLAFTNSGLLLSTGDDGSVKLWQAPGTPGTSKILTQPEPFTSASLSSDGITLATGGKDKQLRLWNLDKGDNRSLATLTTPAVAIAILDRPNRLVAATEKSVLILNLTDGKEVKKWDNLPAKPLTVAGSRDGTQVAVGLADHSVHTFDIAQGKEIQTLNGHLGPVQSIYYTTSGDLATGSTDKTVKVWDLATGTAKKTLNQEAPVTAITQTREGRLITGDSGKNFKIWSLPDGKVEANGTGTSEIRTLAISPDGTRLVVGGVDGRTSIHDTDGKLRESFASPAAVIAAGFSGDGKRIVSVGADSSIRPWTPRLIWQASGFSNPQAVISSSGERVVTGDDQGILKIWQIADGKTIQSHKAHAASIVGLTISADGNRIVSIGSDRLVQVWNLPNPTKPADPVWNPTLKKQLAGDPSAVALSPDGKRLAVCGMQKGTSSVDVLDSGSGLLLQSFPEYPGTVHSLLILSDNRSLLSAGPDKSVHWDDMNCQAVLEAHPAGVTLLAQVASGNVLTAGQDKQIKIWDSTQNKMIRSFGPMPSPVKALAITRDATQVVVGMGKEIRMLNLADGKEMAKIVLPAEVLQVSVSGDKSRVLAGCADHLAQVHDLATGQQVQFFATDETNPLVAYHPGNSQCLTTTTDHGIAVHTLSLVRSIPAAGRAMALALTPDGKALTGGEDKLVRIWNLGNGTLEKTLEGAEQGIQAIAINKNGTLAAAAGADQTTRIYSLADARLIGSFKGPSAVHGLAFSPNQSTLAVGYHNNQVQTWSVPWTPGQPKPPEFGLLQMTYQHDGPVTDLIFNADGSQLWSSSLDKSVRIWKTPSDKEIRNLAHPAIVDAVAFSPVGDLVATGCHDGKLRIFDGTKGTLVKEINAHPFTAPNPPNPIYSLIWTTDGKKVVTGSFDHSAKLWDATSGAMIREFKGYKEKDFEKGHRDGIFCVALSPDGKTLATGSSDRRILLWNVADGSVIKELANPNFKIGQDATAHPGWVYGIRFSPDGKQLISIGTAPRNRGFLAVWNLADGKVLSTQDSEGPIYSLALSADGKTMALGTGLSLPAEGGQEINVSEIVPLDR